MNNRRADILLVEDTPSLARLYEQYLSREDYAPRLVETGGAALDAVAARAPDATLLDLKLPDMHGMDVLRKLKADNPDCAVVVMTAHGSVNVAVEAMQAGACDFLVKPFNADRLKVTLRNALDRRRLTRLVEAYKEDFGRNRFCGFIGSSHAMQVVYRIIDNAASSKATVFITGESGVGKEVCADAIHRRGPRRDKPFVALNCAAIPKGLIESEIFGHVKGAFTGAVANRVGAAAQADGGTLLLDEICEMDLSLQSKLLRFLQTGALTPVGAARQQTVDVRIICATNRNPLEELAAGRFREDLYYRLHVVPIHLPPLRERGDDVLEIARDALVAFAREEGKGFGAFDADAEALLMRQDWPGNVRELLNVVRNVVVLNDGETVRGDMLCLGAAALPAAPAENGAAANGADRIEPLWLIEKTAIEDAIRRCGGSVPKAAAHLGVSPSTIYRKRVGWERAPEP